MDFSKIAEKLFPVLVAAVAWAVGTITTLEKEMIDIKSKMPALITTDGRPTDSPISAEQRHRMKEEIYKDIHDLQVRIKLMEERGRR